MICYTRNKHGWLITGYGTSLLARMRIQGSANILAKASLKKITKKVFKGDVSTKLAMYNPLK